MAVVPSAAATFEMGPRDYLNQLLSLISSLRGGQSRYLPVLLAKVDDTLPTLSSYLAAPISSGITDGRLHEIYDEYSSSRESSQSYTPPTLSNSSSDMSALSVENLNEMQNQLSYSNLPIRFPPSDYNDEIFALLS